MFYSVLKDTGQGLHIYILCVCIIFLCNFLRFHSLCNTSNIFCFILLFVFLNLLLLLTFTLNVLNLLLI